MEHAALQAIEETLDPQDWNRIRQLGHQMVDDMMSYLETVRERPAWSQPSDQAIDSMNKPLPLHPQAAEGIYDEFVTQVLPFNCNNIHPRFWSWVQGCGTPTGMLADMLASGMNANVSLGNHMPMYVERQVLDWSKALFDFPQSAGGILTSGASLANLTALIVARNQVSDKIKSGGLYSFEKRLLVYGSSETHNCVIKAIEAIGVGGENFRAVPVDEHYRIRIDGLKKMIAEDRSAGHLPFCIIGNAGTVNTGAIDDLDGLTQIAKAEKLWLHVDGAFGAIPKILPEWAATFKGIEGADSLAFDFHKWFCMNYEVGCVLIRDPEVYRQSFSVPANYLTHHERGLSAGPESFFSFGLELSRGFKALKVWMLLKEHGLEQYKRLIRQNLNQARYLGSLVDREQHLELLCEVSLNIVCYRFIARKTSTEELNRINKEILMRLQEEGIAAPSYTLLNGVYAIRVAICNHRSKTEDFDLLVQASVRIGKELTM